MHHSFSIYSSTDGHLGCFWISVIVNNAPMNIGVHIFFRISVLGVLKYIPRSGITVLFLIFEVTPYCFPQWLEVKFCPLVFLRGCLGTIIPDRLKPFCFSQPVLCGYLIPTLVPWTREHSLGFRLHSPWGQPHAAELSPWNLSCHLWK